MEFGKVKIDPQITVPTLAEVMIRLGQDPDLAPARRRDLISAVKRMSELTGVDPRSTPASMRVMRPLINQVHPARHDLDLTPKTWSNLRANFRAAIVDPAPTRPRQYAPEWAALRGLLPDQQMRAGLCRFTGFCHDHGISPSAVCDAVFDQFLEDMESKQNLPQPRQCHRRSAHLWNKAAATIRGWPQIQVTLPNYRRPRQSLPINRYPSSLQDELTAYLEFLRGGTDRFHRGPRQPKLAEITVRQRETEIVLALAALVEAGRDPASIGSLSCLVEPDAYETVLRHYLKDDEAQTPRPFAFGLAVTLVSLARRWVKPGHEVLETLRNLKQCLGPQYSGLAKKNDDVLTALDDQDIRDGFLVLPEQLAAWVEGDPPRRARPENIALMMSYAVALAILNIGPMRIKNLAALHLDRHLTRPGGPGSRWLIVLPAVEVKNKVDNAYLLDWDATLLVDRYLERYRPVLAPPGNRYLFPVGSGHKAPHDLSVQLRRVIADWLGVDMTPHQYRHFAADLIEQRLPGSAALIARFLGHKNDQTASKYYIRRNGLAAGQLFDQILQEERRAARSRLRRRP